MSFAAVQPSSVSSFSCSFQLSSTMTKRHNGGNSVSLRGRFAEGANGGQHILIQAAYVHSVAKMPFFVSGSSMSSNTRISMIGTTCAAMMLLSMMSGVGAFQPSSLLSSRSAHVSASSSSHQSPSASTSALNMFTGIIEEMGTVVSLEQRDDMTLWDGTTGSGTELVVKGDVAMDGAYLG